MKQDETSSQAIREKVRELKNKLAKDLHDSQETPDSYDFAVKRYVPLLDILVRDTFPSIASLVEEQAVRIERLEELLSRSLNKLRQYHDQTGGVYGGGEPLQMLTKDIEDLLPPSSL